MTYFLLSQIWRIAADQAIKLTIKSLDKLESKDLLISR